MVRAQPPIEDYAFLSDMQASAFVSRSGSVDWLCWPRFDSAACFTALLHDESAGTWSIAPSEEVRWIERRYRRDTLVLETTFHCDRGTVRIIDCLALGEASMPEHPRAVFPEHIFVRLVRGMNGEVRMTMDFRPRFDYGSIVPWFREHDGVVEAVGGPDALDLSSSLRLRVDDAAVRLEFSVRDGEQVPFLLSYHPSHETPPVGDPSRVEELIEHTASFWTRWASACPYRGRWRDEVVTSLLTLKGLTYAPSGGVVAAASASLPEQLGGPRNWDYRYCWLRDATFTLDALLEYGYTGAAVEWRDWLLRAVAGDPQDMQIMYGVLGERRLLEYELPLEGYAGSRPVRVGNAAHTQFQLDVYGEVMDSFHSSRRAGIDTPKDAWALETAIVDHVCERWREPDEGIWEVRSGPEHFVHSKVMAWVAVDRGIKAIEDFGADGPSEVWSETRDAIRDEVMSRGVDRRLARFRRSYDSSELDASLLMLPVVGFVAADDPIMVNTIEAIQRDLVVDGFVHRYRTDRVDDGLPPGEATFLMCSFWLVDCLVLLERLAEAEALFVRLLATANDLGLLAEQYDAERGRLLGNFPQAFSHVALVTSAAALTSAGKTRAMRRGRA
jgi:GH15 family glucan-1,4-alpha-glucosidase